MANTLNLYMTPDERKRAQELLYIMIALGEDLSDNRGNPSYKKLVMLLVEDKLRELKTKKPTPQD